METRKTLVVSAVLGILAGCGGKATEPVAPSGSSTSAGEKASCGGAEHTEKNHCNAQAKCSGVGHSDKNHCAAMPSVTTK